uniref:ULP_PROTEASE domain-containing protein n=1 Tax=Caenorhabditis tropicalis TaxID=1561998 RepID=A0A1I7TLA3_9PELO
MSASNSSSNEKDMGKRQIASSVLKRSNDNGSTGASSSKIVCTEAAILAGDTLTAAPTLPQKQKTSPSRSLSSSSGDLVIDEKDTKIWDKNMDNDKVFAQFGNCELSSASQYSKLVTKDVSDEPTLPQNQKKLPTPSCFGFSSSGNSVINKTFDSLIDSNFDNTTILDDNFDDNRDTVQSSTIKINSSSHDSIIDISSDDEIECIDLSDDETPSAEKETPIGKAIMLDIKKSKEKLIASGKKIFHIAKDWKRYSSEMYSLVLGHYAAKTNNKVQIAEPELFEYLVENIDLFLDDASDMKWDRKKVHPWIEKNFQKNIKPFWKDLDLFDAELLLIPIYAGKAYSLILVNNLHTLKNEDGSNCTLFLFNPVTDAICMMKEAINNVVLVFLENMLLMLHPGVRFEAKCFDVDSPIAQDETEVHIMSVYHADRIVSNLAEFRKEYVNWKTIFPEENPDLMEHQGRLLLELNVINPF